LPQGLLCPKTPGGNGALLSSLAVSVVRVLNDDDDRDLVGPPVGRADLIDAAGFCLALKLESDWVIPSQRRAERQEFNFQLSDRFWMRPMRSLQKNMRVQAHAGDLDARRGFRCHCLSRLRSDVRDWRKPHASDQRAIALRCFKRWLREILTPWPHRRLFIAFICRRIGEVSATSLSDLRVLLVDDNGPVRTLTRQMLRRMSVTSIREADDGDAALEIFRATPLSFDLIICDWNMPVLCGMEVCKQVHAERPDLPFLLVTGRSDAESVVIAKEAGVSAYISKPFSPQELKLKISAIIERLNRTQRAG
jgi:two-component system chemotaxis response regulator CheY